MNTVYVMCGPIGAGKTYVANRMFPDISCKWNPDKLIEGDWTREKANDAWDKIHGWIRERTSKGKTYIVDSSQALRISRRRLTQYIRQCAELNRFEKTWIICVFVMADFDTCLFRNNQRKRKVPEDTLREYYNNVMNNPPSRRDGYDEVITIDNSHNKGNHCELWTTTEPWPEGWYRD